MPSLESTGENPNPSPLPTCWLRHLGPEFECEYMRELKAFLVQEIGKKKRIYPHGNEIFSAFKTTPLSQVKVVIIGQDPYHGPGQAHGMSFSVKPGINPPPSLVNIFKELQADLNIQPPGHGHLVSWAHRGVLLLNAVLTVEHKKAGSHQGKGWELFTDKVVEVLNREKKGLVFILWGAHAQKKAQNVDRKRHCVIETTHPSPFSAHRGFLGSKPFSRANRYLQSVGKPPVDWAL